ncbi:MAG: pantoate--beta-alanine ligase [Planctomycetota bacterium]|nr:MAG: pantoate--beta-alanine ligase [Planctomycetota bacterium]
MIICETIADVRQKISEFKRKGKRIGFVPTMGNLHEGHLSLISASKEECDITIVSVFVNPTQFSSGEGFEKYPRTLESDQEKLKDLKIDILFLPDENQMYGSSSQTLVLVGGTISNSLEGCSRPEHFNGVTLIVTKLFNIIAPDVAFFGQKDAQQARIIYQFVKDLSIQVVLKVLPIVRESDGLAMSSRNTLLSKENRAIAPSMYEGMLEGAKAIRDGETDPMQVLAIITEHLICFKEIEIDYVAIIDPVTFEEVEEINKDVLIIGAIFLDNIRLIDNYYVDRN